jgi:GR25 family glycosyltransferase involved in LPS biosynthesis
MLNVDRIFVAHCTKLAERKPKVEEALSSLQLSEQTSWIETEPYDLDDIDKYYKFSGEIWDEKVGSLKYQSGCSDPRHITPQELSLVVKHYRAYELIVDAGYESALVLEDDVVFCKGFVNYFNSFLESTPKDWDMIFIGSGAGLRIPKRLLKPNQNAYLKSHPATKCTDSYIITNKAAKILKDTMLPMTLGADFELNYQLYKNDFKVYWWEPPIVAQGSQIGMYKSAIQS